jgi:glucose/mannose-6-phosphate isomerase
MVHRGYILPAYVGPGTLVVASSYSGNTEETLACFEAAIKTGARGLALTTGGKLKALASSTATPVFSFDYKSAPRAALPYSFVTLLCLLQKLGLIHDRSAEFREAVTSLEEQAARFDIGGATGGNGAKQLAMDLKGRISVVYGAELLAEVAHRWKTQINENSKAWAFWEVFPELNHNAVVGYEHPSDVHDRLMVVLLQSKFISPRVKLRYEVTTRLLKRSGIPFRLISGQGKNTLADVLELVLLGDYVSYYLGLLNGSDPGPVQAIDYLKAELGNVVM